MPLVMWDVGSLHVLNVKTPFIPFLVHPVGKEYEVVASTAAAEDCGSGGGVAVKHGMVGKGPVVGMVQVSSIQSPGWPVDPCASTEKRCECVENCWYGRTEECGPLHKHVEPCFSARCSPPGLNDQLVFSDSSRIWLPNR